MVERSRHEESGRRRREEEIEFAENPEQRCPCVLLVDVSRSMQGTPIREVNAGIAEFYQAIGDDDIASQRVELCILAFNHEVKVEQDFTTIAQSTRPPRLEARGGTEMCQAIQEGMRRLENRKQVYRDNGAPYFRPWMVLMTDGEPNDRHLVQSTGQAVQTANDQRQLTFFAVGTEDADMETLGQLAPKQTPPQRLQGFKFREFFQWLSASLASTSRSSSGQQVALPPTSGWATVEA